MRKLILCLFSVLVLSLPCYGQVGTPEGDAGTGGGGNGGNPPQIQYCYVDASTTCADALVTMYFEGLLAGATLICGECDQLQNGNWICPNSNKVVPAVVEDISLPFARRHQHKTGDGPELSGKVSTQDGNNPVDCGSTITCTTSCLGIAVGGVGKKSCGSNPLSNVMPILPRYADGNNCKAFLIPVIVTTH
jgi:hypothetical protein